MVSEGEENKGFQPSDSEKGTRQEEILAVTSPDYFSLLLFVKKFFSTAPFEIVQLKASSIMLLNLLHKL